MQALLALGRWIDRLTDQAGRLASAMVFAATALSVGNALLRYGLNLGSNAWLEAQTVLFGAIMYLGAAHTLRVNEHIRIDIVYSACSERGRLLIDALGLLLLLLPVCLLMTWLSWGFFAASWASGEVSGNAGGLPLWPSKVVIPVGFALLSLQGLSELFKRLAALSGRLDLDTGYEKPQQ